MTAVEWIRAQNKLAERLLVRAEFWRKKAGRARKKETRDEYSARAIEAANCAEVACELAESYEAPPEPNMRAATRERRRR
jgi:hypothetical protein